MSNLPIWRSLESVPGLAGVASEWKSLLGPEYDEIKAFFRPNGRLAEAIPCPSKRPCDCCHAVIQHAPDDIVAVCQCDPTRCDTTPLSRSDIVIYEVNAPALAEAIALAFQIKPEIARVEGLYMTWRLGTYQPTDGKSFLSFLTLQMEPDDFRTVVERLLLKYDKPFVVLTPTGGLHVEACEEMAAKRKSHIIPLEDRLVWDGQGNFSAEPASTTPPPFNPDDWNWPGLPESLKSLAKALPTDTKIATYDLGQRLGREPSRIISDNKSGRWGEWVERFIGRERGFWWLKQHG